jgi:16S rRNA (guanine(966)-N(2))-methyltransferase RsmD
MRVIAGKFRSRHLSSLPGMDLRPTSDRLRETLFNVLTAGDPAALEGKVWVDLYAGTGAVGIEALSRGARMVYFVESTKRAAELVRGNLQALGVESGFRLLNRDVRHALRALETEKIVADFVFLDPPYQMEEAYRSTLESLAEARLASNALVIAEHQKKFDPGDNFGALRRYRALKQGDAVLSFYRSE